MSSQKTAKINMRKHVKGDECAELLLPCAKVCTDSSGLVQLDSVLHPQQKRKEATGPGMIFIRLLFCLM